MSNCTCIGICIGPSLVFILSCEYLKPHNISNFLAWWHHQLIFQYLFFKHPKDVSNFHQLDFTWLKCFYLIESSIMSYNKPELLTLAQNNFKILYLRHFLILSLEKLRLDGDGKIHSPMEFVIKNSPWRIEWIN